MAYSYDSLLSDRYYIALFLYPLGAFFIGLAVYGADLIISVLNRSADIFATDFFRQLMKTTLTYAYPVAAIIGLLTVELVIRFRSRDSSVSVGHDEPRRYVGPMSVSSFVKHPYYAALFWFPLFQLFGGLVLLGVLLVVGVVGGFAVAFPSEEFRGVIKTVVLYFYPVSCAGGLLVTALTVRVFSKLQPQ